MRKQIQSLWIVTVALSIVVSGCSIERFLNKQHVKGPHKITPEAQALHEQLWVADLHSDSLLWDRMLHKRRRFGHIDVPRLLEGDVDFFIASTVSKTPWGLNMESNDDDSNMLVMLSILQLWPPNTWGSMLNRVLYQGKKMERFEKRADGKLRIVRDRGQLQQLITDQNAGQRVVGTVLSTEGGHVLEGEIKRLDVLYEAGFRLMGLVHFFDNKLGGSAHGLEKGGITEFGKQVIAEMEARNMIVDLSHASAPLFADAISVATQPVIVSHTGVQGTCPGPRNLSDHQLELVKQNGGLVGVGVFVPAICKIAYAETARTFRYVADRIGVEHVALGSDYDGATSAPTDISGIGILTQEMQQQGFSVTEITAIMGGNIQRFLLNNLPASEVPAQ